MRHICISINGRPSDIISLDNKNLTFTETLNKIRNIIPKFVQAEVCDIKSFEKAKGNTYKVISTKGDEYTLEWHKVYIWKEAEIDELIEGAK